MIREEIRKECRLQIPYFYLFKNFRRADEGNLKRYREEELAGRIEVLEKLRGSVRDLEKEKRETLKRYREQVSFPLLLLLVLRVLSSH